MNIQTITKMLIEAGIEPNEAKKEIKMLLEHFCHYTELDRCKGIELSEKQLEILKEKAEKRANTKLPIQYIIGEAYFMGEFFKVTPDVLIPRDETELLVRKAIEFIRQDDLKEVLDIGTGSGCIACTIAHKTDATVLGVDISSDALRVALDNVTRLGINNRAVFRKSDLFSKVRDDEKFDMIISNPPYGLRFYREIVEQAPEFLKPNGKLLFELGIGESGTVKTFMEKDFKDIVVEKDLAGIDRIIYGTLK